MPYARCTSQESVKRTDWVIIRSRLQLVICAGNEFLMSDFALGRQPKPKV
jgi:hypothetical protein